MNQNFTNQVIEFKALNQFGYGLINRASVVGSPDSPNKLP